MDEQDNKPKDVEAPKIKKPRRNGVEKYLPPRDPSKLPPQLIPHLFKKGPEHRPSPGRTKGSKNSMTQAAIDWAKGFLNENPEYRSTIEARLKEGKAPLLEKYLWERVVGKPKEHIEISTTGPLFHMEGEGPKEE